MLELILLPSFIVFIGATLASLCLSALLISNWKASWWGIGYGFTLNSKEKVEEGLAAKHINLGVRLFVIRRSLLKLFFKLFPVSLLLAFLLWVVEVVL